ncbi:hypothetical protein G3R49_12475 [Shewanella sp. WXL01]|uniref:terminase large subunit domain-containing protein n=1 Tax=Shewanella sp. WXL01 TaxID=2709721 RepID=UPI0014386AC2|nr:terminase family protein [Shewanella sp. WXL01]NKF51373.1 hypothetical protein [Shewanella sp. WXL01]
MSKPDFNQALNQDPIAQAVSDALTPFDPNELLLGYQKRWIADESQLKIAEKSRRTGLTWAEAADAVLAASASRSAGGTNHFYVGSNKEMAREFIDAAAMWAKAFNKAAGEIQEEIFRDADGDKDILTFAIYFESGFKIQALSSNPSNLRGMQGNVTIDEAAFHERLAEVLKAANALTMWGAKVRLISTHNGTDNLFNELINDSRAGKKAYSVHRITLDDACAEGLYKRICQIRKIEWSQQAEDEWKQGLLKATATEEDALEEYYCVPKKGGGTYIKRVLIEEAMVKDGSIPIITLEAPKDFETWSEQHRHIQVREWCEEIQLHIDKLDPSCHHAFGEDFARKGDLSIFCPLQIRPDLSKRVPFVLELSKLPYDAQREVLFYLCDRLPRLRGMSFDATGNGGYLAEAAMLRYGTDMVDQVMLNDKWYREWMPKLKAEFEDLNLEIPRHQDIVDDMGKIKVVNGTPKIDKGSDKSSVTGLQRHGDFAVGLLMAVRASWMEGGVIEFTPLPSKKRTFDSASLSERDHSYPDHSDDYQYNYERGAY